MKFSARGLELGSWKLLERMVVYLLTFWNRKWIKEGLMMQCIEFPWRSEGREDLKQGQLCTGRKGINQGGLIAASVLVVLCQQKQGWIFQLTCFDWLQATHTVAKWHRWLKMGLRFLREWGVLHLSQCCHLPIIHFKMFLLVVKSINGQQKASEVFFRTFKCSVWHRLALIWSLSFYFGLLLLSFVLLLSWSSEKIPSLLVNTFPCLH